MFNRQGKSTIFTTDGIQHHAHFCPQKQCIEKKNHNIPHANSIGIPDPMKTALNEMHKTLLAKEFAPDSVVPNFSQKSQ